MADDYAIYTELKFLVESTPALESCNLADPDLHRWLGRAYTAVAAVEGGADAINFRIAADNLGNVLRPSNAHTIRGTLHRAFSKVEGRLQGSGGGAFIRPGDVWNAFVKISDIFNEAKSDLFVVDPYMDDSLLRDYAVRLKDGVTLRLLTTNKAARFTAALIPAAQKWNATHAPRPAQVRLADKPIHDRIIGIDRQSAWIVTQSLKDLGATAPATVTRFVDDLTPEKLAAYEEIWATATVEV